MVVYSLFHELGLDLSHLLVMILVCQLSYDAVERHKFWTSVLVDTPYFLFAAVDEALVYIIGIYPYSASVIFKL